MTKRAFKLRNQGALWIVAASAMGLFACEAVLGLGSLSERADSVGNDASQDVGSTTADSAGDDSASGGGDAGLDVTCPSSWNDAGTVAGSITPPTGVLLLHLSASGTQNYQCQNTSGSSWSFVGVSGDLLNCEGDKVGAESTSGNDEVWTTTTDSSAIMGAVDMTYSPSDGPSTDLPSILYSSLNPSGTGILSRVNWIQRLDPENGQTPPLSTCSGGVNGMISKVPYTADFWFYGTP